MNADAVRTALQHELPVLKSITQQEIEQMRWVTKKKIFLALFENTTKLSAQSEELKEIVHIRSQEINNEKANGMSKDDRLDQEITYKTKFLRVVLAG